MATRAHIPADQKLREGGSPEPGYDEWKRDKIERALAGAKAEAGIPAAQVWRDLGLET